MEQTFRYQIAACPKCGSRKTISWAPCDICGSAIIHETRTIPVTQENDNSEASFELDIRLAA